MAGFKIQFLTDTDGVRRGTKDIEKALEDVSDSLDDVTNDAEGAADRMEKSFRELAQDTKQQARAMGDDIKGSYDKAAVDVGEATTQMSEDGFSNAKEVAASFDGSAESIVDGFQGAAAEMFSGFGPAGAAAGLAAAAGLGLITSQLEKQKEEAAEAEAAIWDMAQGAIDAGVYTVTELQKTEMLKEWLGDEDKRKEAQDFVDKFGGSVSDYLAAQLDLGDKRAETERRINDYYQKQIDGLDGVAGQFVDIETTRRNIETLQKNALDDLYSEDTAIQAANESAQEVLQTFKDVGIEIFEWKEPTLDMQAEFRRMSEMDATPTFKLEDPLRQAQSIYDILNKASKIKLPTTRSVR